MEKQNSMRDENIDDETRSRNNRQAIRGINTWAAIIGGVCSIAAPLIINLTMGMLSSFWQIIVIAIAVGAFVIAVGGCWIVTAICEARSAKKNAYNQIAHDVNLLLEEDRKLLQQQREAMSDTTDKLTTTTNRLSGATAEFVKTNDLLEQILDGEHVAELESSVGAYAPHYEKLDIYILASSFTLELSDGVGALLDPIVWNLRKGVTYHYLIPDQQADINKYEKMLYGWYSHYSSFLKDKESFDAFWTKYKSNNTYKYSQFWSSDYEHLVTAAKDYWENSNGNLAELKKQCAQLFNRHIYTHIEEPSLFFVTVAAYENKKGQYDAIIKIPTHNPNEKYYALRVSETQIEDFMRQFMALYKSTPFEDSSGHKNYGGMYKRDSSFFD